jgi:glycosyl transferase family 25
MTAMIKKLHDVWFGGKEEPADPEKIKTPMKTLIVNLQTDVARRKHMTELLKRIPLLDFQFIDAVDGRIMPDEERKRSFDVEKSVKIYGRPLNAGEQGCTLSHQKCYKMLIESEWDKVLILEDDADFNANENSIDALREAWDSVGTDKPEILLLSGDYWYTSVLEKTDHGKLVSVFDGGLTHSYIINRPAAETLLDGYPFFIADAWYYFRSLGVDLRAIRPHLFGQKSNEFKSRIQTTSKDGIDRKKMLFKENMSRYYRGVVRRVLGILKQYEQC